jgi:hypothetical protein
MCVCVYVRVICITYMYHVYLCVRVACIIYTCIICVCVCACSLVACIAYMHYMCLFVCVRVICITYMYYMCVCVCPGHMHYIHVLYVFVCVFEWHALHTCIICVCVCLCVRVACITYMFQLNKSFEKLLSFSHSLILYCAPNHMHKESPQVPYTHNTPPPSRASHPATSPPNLQLAPPQPPYAP